MINKLIFDILFFLGILLISFLPYIIAAIMAYIVICLFKRKMQNKNNKLEVFLYVIIIIVCVCVSLKATYSFILYISAAPDKLYAEMNEINDNQTLIGLSKEQVVELLGEPNRKEDEDVYYYDAGKITNYLFFGERDFYDLRVVFDENDIVKGTSIKEIV